jgi:hypothetical protein
VGVIYISAFEGKPVIGPMVMGKSKLITDKCTFFEGWQQNFKEPGPEGDILMEYSLMGCTAKV